MLCDSVKFDSFAKLLNPGGSFQLLYPLHSAFLLQLPPHQRRLLHHYLQLQLVFLALRADLRQVTQSNIFNWFYSALDLLALWSQFVSNTSILLMQIVNLISRYLLTVREVSETRTHLVVRTTGDSFSASWMLLFADCQFQLTEHTLEQSVSVGKHSRTSSDRIFSIANKSIWKR